MVTLIRILVVVVTGFGEPCVIGIIVVILVVGVLKLGLVGVVRSGKILKGERKRKV